MTKLGTRTHIINTYLRGRDYIITDLMEDNEQVGLQLIRGYIIANWDTIQWILNMEESDAN